MTLVLNEFKVLEKFLGKELKDENEQRLLLHKGELYIFGYGVTTIFQGLPSFDTTYMIEGYLLSGLFKASSIGYGNFTDDSGFSHKFSIISEDERKSYIEGFNHFRYGFSYDPGNTKFILTPNKKVKDVIKFAHNDYTHYGSHVNFSEMGVEITDGARLVIISNDSFGVSHFEKGGDSETVVVLPKFIIEIIAKFPGRKFFIELNSSGGLLKTEGFKIYFSIGKSTFPDVKNVIPTDENYMRYRLSITDIKEIRKYKSLKEIYLCCMPEAIQLSTRNEGGKELFSLEVGKCLWGSLDVIVKVSMKLFLECLFENYEIYLDIREFNNPLTITNSYGLMLLMGMAIDKKFDYSYFPTKNGKS